MCSVYIERDVSVWLCPVRMIGPYILRHHMIALGSRSRVFWAACLVARTCPTEAWGSESPGRA